MKNKINVDRFFKEKFSNLGQPDASQDWMAMEKMLNQQSKKAIYLRWSAVILLLLVAFGTWFSFDKYKSTQIASRELKNSASIIEQKTSSNSAAPAPITNNTESASIPNHKTPSSTIVISPPHRKLEKTIEKEAIPQSDIEVSIIPNESEIRNEKASELTWNLNSKKQFLLFENEVVSLSKKNTTELFLPYSKWQFGLAPFMGLNTYKRSKPKSDAIASESPLNNWNLGLVAYAKYGNWNIRLGINNLNLTEKTNYKQTQYSYVYDTSFALIKRNYETTLNGKTTALVKETITTTTDSTEVVNCPDCLAKFQYFQVPLSAQYTFGKKRLLCFVEAGVSLSFLRKASGLYSASGSTNKEGEMEYQISELSKSNVNKTLLSTHARLGLKYRLTTKTSVFGSYGLSYFQQSMLTSYSQKAQMQQIQLGLEFGF
jgi:hypothetical protein